MQTQTKISLRSLLFCSFIFSANFLSACSGSSQSASPPAQNEMPPTVFDSTPAAPKADSVKTASFIYTMERKFKREAIRNPIDLHFKESGDGMKIIVTYDRKSDPTLAASIADAAVEHAKRLKREDPEMRDVNLSIDREVSPRPDTP